MFLILAAFDDRVAFMVVGPRAEPPQDIEDRNNADANIRSRIKSARVRLARGNPFAIIPVAILLGGVKASGGVIQRREHLSDACVDVLQGIIFVFVLASDAIYGRIGFLKGKS